MDNIQNEPQGVDENLLDSESATEQDVNQVVGDDTQAPEEQQEDRVTFDERQQAKVNELISEKVAKTYEERRAREAAEQKAKELEALLPKPQVPEIPPMPNPDDYFDKPDEFKAKVSERDRVIKERVEFEAKQKFEREQQERQIQRQTMEESKKQELAIAKYSKRAVDFGLSEEQMRQDAQVVSGVINSPELDSFVLNDSHGALITNYLAKNPLELDALQDMDVANASVYIATQIKPKLADTKKQSSTPKPVEIVGGNGVPEKEHPALQGVKFE